MEIDELDVLEQLENAKAGEADVDLQYLKVTATVEKMTDMNEHIAR